MEDTNEELMKSRGQFAGFLDFIREEKKMLQLYQAIKEEFTFYEAHHAVTPELRVVLMALWKEYVGDLYCLL